MLQLNDRDSIDTQLIWLWDPCVRPIWRVFVIAFSVGRPDDRPGQVAWWFWSDSTSLSRHFITNGPYATDWQWVGHFTVVVSGIGMMLEDRISRVSTHWLQTKPLLWIPLQKIRVYCDCWEYQVSVAMTFYHIYSCVPAVVDMPPPLTLNPPSYTL